MLVEQRDAAKLGRLLAAEVPPSWPPEGCAEADLHRMHQRLASAPAELPWHRRYVVRKKTADARPQLAGHLLLAGPPKFGTVSVAQLSLCPEHGGDGLEREAMGAVLDWAMDQDGVERIATELADDAEHPGEPWASLGFVADPETGRCVRTRAAWLADGPVTPRALVPQPPDAPIVGIPKMAASVFDKLLGEPLREPEALRTECTEYLAMIERAAQDNPYVDHELARQIAGVCDALLAGVTATTPEHTRRQIQAAARYFVTEEDGDSDLAIGGLDEDAAVANAVAEHLGRGDLVSEFP